MTPAHPLLEPVLALVRAAGDAILAVYGDGFDVAEKADRSPLTEADLAANRVLVEGLAARTPDVPVLSEESAQVPWSERRRWPRYWLVDPLDGTREFVKRNGEFTVNVALVEGHDVALGVVLAPVTGELCFGVRGQGARRLGGAGDAPLRVRPRAAGTVRIAGSRSHRDPRFDAALSALGEHELMVLGSSLKFLRLADGSADVYLRLGPTSEWDTAAAQAVLEAAGGTVTDLAFRPLRYNTKESLLNPDFLAVADPGHDWRARLAPALDAA